MMRELQKTIGYTFRDLSLLETALTHTSYANEVYKDGLRSYEKHIYARANDYVHRNILQAFDIDRVLIPEERAAHDLVRQMELGVKTSQFRVDGKYSVFMFCIPKVFVGHKLNDLHLNEEFGLKVIAVKQAGKSVNNLGIAYKESAVAEGAEDDIVLQADDELVCYGKESDFRKFCRML